jgi:nucleoside-diphosphate-sugar epimerase
MRVLYVGGSGYVGRLALPLLRQRFAVRVLDLRAPAGGDEYVRGDATGHAAVLAALAGVDAVIHGAMAAGGDAAAAFGASVTSVHQVLSAAYRAGVPHAVYLSSLSVYADPVSRRLDESAVPDATDVYGLTKRLGEEVCRAAVAEFGLSVNILRLAWPTPDHLWPAWGRVTPPARPAGPGSVPACATAATDVAAAIAAALSYRDGLQAFTISADELAGRWSTAKARDLLAWHPRFTPPPITLPYGPLGQLARSRLTPSGPS